MGVNIHNTPVEIMRVPVPDGKDVRERGIKAKALPMAAGMEWYERARALETDAMSASVPAQRADAMLAILDHVCDYDPAWPAHHVEAIRKEAGSVQIMTAFELLIKINDPFSIAREKKLAETEVQTRAISALAKLGIKMDMDSIGSKHLPAISVSSENDSE